MTAVPSVHLPHGQFVPNGIDTIDLTRFTWIQPGARYLEDTEKAFTLRRWAQYLAGGSTDAADGRPDTSVLDLVARLNARSGVCVVQSCSGHPGVNCLSGGIEGGQLWLRLDEFTSTRVRHHACDLARDESIYRFGTLFLPHGLEVWWIAFQWLGTRPDDQMALTERIAAFFEGLE